MSRPRRTKPTRHRVGRVSFYLHHGAWYIYYRDCDRQVRRRVTQTEEDAARIAAQVNSQLLAAAPTLLAFTPVGIPELRRQFLDYHDLVQRSSLATLGRYKAATRYLEDFAARLPPGTMAHELRSENFVAHLRSLSVAPNGHPNSPRRPLRDKGIHFILEFCRSKYGFAARMRNLPPNASNSFADLRLDRMRIDDAKPVFVFDAGTELAFFQAAKDGTWGRLLESLHVRLNEAGKIDWDLFRVDGSSIRASRDAAGASPSDGTPSEPADHALGRSRGGYGSKIHLICNGRGLPMAVTVAAGQRHESTQFEAVMGQVVVPRKRGRPRLRPRRLAGDKGYSYGRIRRYLRRRGIKAVIPTRKDQKRLPGFEKGTYRRRNVVERCIGWLKDRRRLATRFEKLAENFLAMVKLAMLERLLKALLPDTG